MLYKKSLHKSWYCRAKPMSHCVGFFSFYSLKSQTPPQSPPSTNRSTQPGKSQDHRTNKALGLDETSVADYLRCIRPKNDPLPDVGVINERVEWIGTT